jgi:large subunit ribosomal protein L6
MSRVAKVPVSLPKGVEFKLDGGQAVVKGPKGTLSLRLDPSVEVVQEGAELQIRTPGTAKPYGAMAGTTRALLANMVQGVSQGFQKKLELVGVGYRAQAQGKVLNLTLGFLAPGGLPGPRGHHDRDAEPDGSRGQRHRSPESRPGGRGHPRLSPAGALQGQGRAVLG